MSSPDEISYLHIRRPIFKNGLQGETDVPFVVKELLDFGELVDGGTHLEVARSVVTSASKEKLQDRFAIQQCVLTVERPQ